MPTRFGKIVNDCPEFHLLLEDTVGLSYGHAVFLLVLSRIHSPRVDTWPDTLVFKLTDFYMILSIYICMWSNLITILLAQPNSITYFVASSKAQTPSWIVLKCLKYFGQEDVGKLQCTFPRLFSLVNPQCAQLWCRQVTHYIFTINNSTAYIIDWLKCNPFSLQKPWFISAMIVCQEQNYPLH